VQQMKYTEEEWCIEWTWLREHKRQKNIKCKACVQEDNEADRAWQYRRTMMRLVSH
jgi:hypothetical protein